MPLWRTLGHATWIIRARTLPKTLAVIAAAAAIGAGLYFIPRDFNLEAEGTLKPVVRREIFAPIDGEVIEVAVDHNQRVAKGDVMVRLRNPEMEVQLTEIRGQLLTTLAEQARVEGQIGGSQRRQMDASDARALQAEQQELKVKYGVLQEKLRLQMEREKDLVIKSPIDGVVVSWDVEKTLRSRPIMTGQVLLEVADLSQAMYLELDLPEKREGHLDQYVVQQNLNQPDSKLVVSYILATDPDKPLAAEMLVNTISTRAEASEEHGAIIKMRASPEQEPLRELNPRPGAKVIAKVYCGQRSSGFVFFHEIVEWCYKFFF